MIPIAKQVYFKTLMYKSNFCFVKCSFGIKKKKSGSIKKNSACWMWVALSLQWLLNKDRKVTNQNGIVSKSVVLLGQVKSLAAILYTIAFKQIRMTIILDQFSFRMGKTKSKASKKGNNWNDIFFIQGYISNTILQTLVTYNLTKKRIVF